MSEKLRRKWARRGSNNLIDIMDKVSDGLSINFEAASEDARKILKEARAHVRKKGD